MKKIAHALLVTAMAGGMAVASATGASAAHCVDDSENPTTPGFSYFGTDHVQEADHAEGGNPGPHAGTPGASNCSAAPDNPADRAPGKNS